MKIKRARSRKSAVINNSRWVAYATAGVATAIAGATSAEATTIHYSGPINHAFSGISFLTFALDNGADLGFGHIPGRAIFRVEPFNGFNTGAGDTYGLYGYLLRLAANVAVSGQAFSGGSHFASDRPHTHWAAKGPGFIGFRFNGGSGIEYGWARVRMDSGQPLNNFTLVDFAWGDVGTTILTGQTAPESGVRLAFSRSGAWACSPGAESVGKWPLLLKAFGVPAINSGNARGLCRVRCFSIRLI
jgi:hypothetical protein